MAAYGLSAERDLRPLLPRPMEAISVALIIAYAVFLAGSFLKGTWLLAPDGTGVPTDFVNVWAAGKLALAGHAAAAYDWPTHKLAEDTALGAAFDGYYGWHYPPPFLFAATALATLPYTLAFLVWTFGTFPAYLAAIRGIVGTRAGYLLAAAFPPVLANFFVGQNGFLSAALFGGTLILIERRQTVFAAVLLGLLTYKPHLGLLFPIALAAAAGWRVMAMAAVVAALLAAASWLAFGTDSWIGFAAHLGQSSQAVFAQGVIDWSKLQTPFGLVRDLGAGETAAWTVQAAVILIAAGAVALVWRSRVSFDVKAAALGTGTLLVTPYLFVYDLTVLAVPLAYLLRLGRTRGFAPYERAGIGIACLLILIFILPFVKVPVGLVAVLIVAALIARRARAEGRALAAV